MRDKQKLAVGQVYLLGSDSLFRVKSIGDRGVKVVILMSGGLIVDGSASKSKRYQLATEREISSRKRVIIMAVRKNHDDAMRRDVWQVHEF